MITSSALRIWIYYSKIPCTTLAGETGIPPSRLRPDAKTPFSAAELTALCSYLQLDPLLLYQSLHP